MIYDIKDNGNYKVLPDILRRVKQRNAVASGQFIFDTYDVRNGEKPEDIAFKWFGDAQLHWVILMTNNITDRYYQWPMNDAQFAEFLADKYDNPDAIHHYEIPKFSGNTTSQGPNDYSHLVEVNSDTDNAVSVSFREYEERLQDKYRSIKLLNQRFLSDFLEEFDKLIKE
tara:strand:- start:287 stop:796 length:510 start_codon:yes stop_codon:yes gene_type:complete